MVKLLAEKLKAARFFLKIPKTEIAKKLGKSTKTISDFENGKKEPSIADLHFLSKTYRRRIEYFIDDGQKISNDKLDIRWSYIRGF